MSIESGSTPMQPASAAVATPVLDPGITLALAQAADAAYQDFARQPLVLPDGWALAGRWTGWDPTPLGGSEEAYGLALRRVDAPSELIFAFRGTASLDDALDDADFPQVEFVASDGAASEGGVRTGARVAAGFYGIYSDTGPGMSQPMRAQHPHLQPARHRAAAAAEGTGLPRRGPGLPHRVPAQPAAGTAPGSAAFAAQPQLRAAPGAARAAAGLGRALCRPERPAALDAQHCAASARSLSRSPRRVASRTPHTTRADEIGLWRRSCTAEGCARRRSVFI